MSIIDRSTRQIKLARPFAEGIEPYFSGLSPLPISGLMPLSCPLPTVDGLGLSEGEADRVRKARYDAMTQVTRNNPRFTRAELDAASNAAAKAELVKVLSERPRLTPLPSAPCCGSAEAVPCLACDSPSLEPDDQVDEPEYASAEEWPAWTDGERWEAGPETNRLTFAELVERQARGYRSWDNAAGQAIAKNLDQLSDRIRFAKASTPEELEARIEVLDEDLRAMSDAWDFEPELTASGRWA